MSPHSKAPYAPPATTTANMNFYYYALPLTDGRWQLLSSRRAEPEYYADKAAALLAASGHCRRQWEESGTPYGVRVRNAEGNWLDALLFGVNGPAVSLAGATIA